MVEYILNSHLEIRLGKCARRKFENESENEQWYEGVISSYNGLTGKYGIYFPCDGMALFDDEDMINNSHDHHGHYLYYQVLVTCAW